MKLRTVGTLCLALALILTFMHAAVAEQWAETHLLREKPEAWEHVAPYPYLHGGSFTGEEQPQSPDPLVQYRWDETPADAPLQSYYLLPVEVRTEPPGSFENLDALKDGGAATIKGEGDIMLDFGVESAAWLEFSSPDLNGEVEMSISEYNQPAILNAGAQHPVKTAAPVRHGDVYRLELNDLLYEGVRFGWIHVRGVDTPWRLENLRLVCQVKPSNYTGSFACSDPLLTRIWYTGAYTVKLNLLDDYIGAILMERSDRHSWTGDAHTSQAASLVAFGNYGFIKHNLARTAEITNNIESYAMYWVQSLLDYLDYTGDYETFAEYIPNVEQKLAHAFEIMGTQPELGFFGWDERLGAGFENPSNPETWRAYDMLVIRTTGAFATALRQADKQELAQKYQQLANEYTQRYSKEFADHGPLGFHDTAAAVNAGVAGSKLGGPALNTEQFKNPATNISFSPFNQYFVLRAMARLGMHETALNSARRCWGGQLALGATTFWEVFRPSWQDFLESNDPVPNNQCGYTSLCHPWSAGVTTWLTEEIAGIRPTAPGFENWSIAPNLGDSLTWVEAEVMTPQGPLSMRYDDSKGVLRVNAPEGTTGVVSLPVPRHSILRVTEGDRVLYERPSDGVQRMRAMGFQLTEIVGGEHTFKFEYAEEEEQREPQAPQPVWPAELLRRDTETQGAWQGTYGEDGYAFFNYRAAGEDLVDLPPYVARVTPRREVVPGTPRDIQWAADSNDPRILALPEEDAGALGAIATQNPRACFQTTSVDVVLEDEQPFEMALYFVDWDDAERWMAVELFDLETLAPIAPVQEVRDFQGGVYLVYRCSQSVRVRIDHIRGGDAVLSSVFFDPAK